MAINISRKVFLGDECYYSINDKIDYIEFYPSTGIIALWAFLITLGMLISIAILVHGELLSIIVIVGLLIYGLKTLSKVEPILLIRFTEGDYFLKKRCFWKKGNTRQFD